MAFYLMRHGQTIFNMQGLTQGVVDSPLTEEGIQQAKKAGAFFEEVEIGFDKVFSSTQERATDTAKLVSGMDDVKQLKGIKEMNFGEFEAQPWNLLPKFLPGANNFEDLLVPYGGEAIADVGVRVDATIRQLFQETAGQEVLVVSHGAAIWAFLLHNQLEQLLPEDFRISNCSIFQLDMDGDQIRLVRLVDPIREVEWLF